MVLSSIDDIIDGTLIVMSGAADSISSDAMELVVGKALTELGLVLPVADGINSYWAVERTKRHTLRCLETAAAMKFQYKKIHLEHRFLQLSSLIKSLDKEFEAFLLDNPEAFPGRATAEIDPVCYISNGESFGTL